MRARLPLRSGLLYAAGDVGPSLTLLCLAFYWLYFLIDVVRMPPVTAGLVHGSGFVFSAVGSIWAGHWLDRHVTTTRARLRLIAALGVLQAACFAALWIRVPQAVEVPFYVALSWAFHLCFALVYLAYLSLTALLASSAQDRIDLTGYRFGGTMVLSIVVIGAFALAESSVAPASRYIVLGMAIALVSAATSVTCGLGLTPALGGRSLGLGEGRVAWREAVGARILWWATASNLSVWFVVQMVMVLTAFLCASAGLRDATMLLLLQVSILGSVAGSGVLTRRWPAARVMQASAVLWCAGAVLWWNATAPTLAVLLLGAGIGAGTVLAWARMPEALDRFAEDSGRRVDARAYAGLTVLRDLVSGVVPVVAAFVVGRYAVGTPESGAAAAALLIASAVACAAAVIALRVPARAPAAGAGRAAAPR